MLRTHTCGELSQKNVGKIVELAGWCHTRRDHGGVIFIDLRDRYGVTQVVFDPSHNKNVHGEAEHISREFVIQVKGKVRERPEGMKNKKLKTGEIEVIIDKLVVLNKAETPPIEIDDRIIANEDTRLKYRYLDLRRESMQKNIHLRHNAAQAAREFLSKEDFLEIETPVLVRSTPEGARDYIVPSRVHPGKFFALPQSPQLYKQILMVSGFDRYFQIPRCLRDEDLRADRQPEHTQIDLEMSFVEEADVMHTVEGLFQHMFQKVLNIKIKTPFPVMSYEDSMNNYGIDKPDLRFDLQLIDVTEIVKKSDFKVFKEAEVIKCINPEHDFTRNEIDNLIDWTTKNGGKGLAWMKVTDKGLESSIVKFFSADIQKKIIDKTKAKKGSILLFVADDYKTVSDVLSRLRNELAGRLKLTDNKDFKFCWITDFPLFEVDEETNGLKPSHHIFTSPKVEDLKQLDKDPIKVKARHYDLVLNGVELGSGSIRVTNPELQEKLLKIIGMDKKEAEKRFGFLLNSFKYGTPPHGGMGLGFDRIVALMCGTHDIREVIAFPKNKKAECPMDGSPTAVGEDQLKELNIRTVNPKG